MLPIAFLSEWRQSGKRLWVIASVVLISTVTQIPGVQVEDQEIHQIKVNLLTPEEQKFAPSDYVAAWILLRHKLVLQNEVYRTSEFHVLGDRELNLTRYRTLIGLDIWTEQLARQLKKPAMRWLPILAFFAIGCLTAQLGKTLKAGIHT